MTGQDLIINLNQRLDQLEQMPDELMELGEKKAHTERDYRVALQKQMSFEKSNGAAVTTLSDICRGKEDIAELKLERDIAESNYKAMYENINIKKKIVDLINDQIQREWGRR